MSRFGHWVDRVSHKVGGQVSRSAKQFGGFTQRSVRGVEGYTHRFGQQFARFESKAVHQVEHDFQRSVVYTAKFSPYITAAAAFVVNLIPALGQIFSLVIVAIGTIANRWGGYYAGRIEGMSTQDARNYGRTIMRRNLTSGLIGSALGGIASMFGISLAGGSDVAAGAESLAGEAGHFNDAAVGEHFAAAEAENWLPGAVQGAAEFPQGYATVAEGTQLGASVPASSSGFLGNAWNWIYSNPEKLLTGAYTVYSQVMKKITPAPGQLLNFSFAGGSGSGGDPGGPGPGGGGGDAVDWGNIEEAAVGFFAEYGELLAIALGLALVLSLLLR